MRRLRVIAGLLTGLLFFGIAGCGGTTVRSDSPNYGPPPVEQPRRPGMSTRQKVLLLAGAAALYYLYQKNKNKQGEGAQGRYYRSRNGRIYYRDRNGKAVWVTPPPRTAPLRVSPEEYERVTGRRIDDYDGGVIEQAPAGL
jgi:hypothetical protein